MELLEAPLSSGAVRGLSFDMNINLLSCFVYALL